MCHKNEYEFANIYYETIFATNRIDHYLNVEQNGNSSTTKCWASQIGVSGIDVLFLYLKTKLGFMKRFSKQEVYKIVSNIHR